MKKMTGILCVLFTASLATAAEKPVLSSGDKIRFLCMGLSPSVFAAGFLNTSDGTGSVQARYPLSVVIDNPKAQGKMLIVNDTPDHLGWLRIRYPNTPYTNTQGQRQTGQVFVMFFDKDPNGLCPDALLRCTVNRHPGCGSIDVLAGE